MHVELSMKYANILGLIAILSCTGCVSTETRVLQVGANLKKAAHTVPRDFTAFSADRTHINADTLSEKKLRKYTVEKLQELYSVANALTFFFLDTQEYFDFQEKLFTELAKRGKIPPDVIKDEYDTRLARRDFNKAQELLNQFSDTKLPVLPEIEDSFGADHSGTWLAFGISNNGGKAKVKKMPIPDGKKIVMVMSPGCHFSVSAIQDLMADPGIAPVLKEYGLFVSRDFAPIDLAAWALRFDVNPHSIYIAYKDRNFAGINLRSYPGFYFMENGKILDYMVGWQADKTKKTQSIARFRKGLGAVALSS